MKRRTIIAATALAGGLVLSVLTASGAQAHPSGGPATAHDDAYLLSAGRTLFAHDSVLENDSGADGTLISHTNPTHGALTMNQDGTFSYVPTAGFTGVDTFTYTVNDAVKLYNTNLPPLATIGGVKITGGAYGSSLAPVPGSNNEYYGLTDRGPNVTAPDASGAGQGRAAAKLRPGDRQVQAGRHAGDSRADDPAARGQRRSVQRPRQYPGEHRRDDRGPRWQDAGAQPERI